MLSTASQLGSGAALRIYIEDVAVRQFKKLNRFYDLLDKRTLDKGNHVYTLNVPARTVTSISQSTLTEGTTPNEVAFTYTQVAVICTQYGTFSRISDVGDRDSVFNLYEETAFELGRNIAEVADKVIQNELLTNGTYVFYAGAQTARANLATTDYLKTSDLAKAYALLVAKAAPGIDGTNYAGVLHPFVVHDVRTDATVNGGWTDMVKYAMPEKLLNGEVSMVHNIRVLMSQTIPSFLGGSGGTVNIFPSYFVGQRAYTVVESQPMQTIIKSNTEGGAENPLNLYGSVAVKIRFGVKITKQESLIRCESTTSLASQIAGLPY